MPPTHFPSHSTPFPNRLLDALMPALKDTEWRLLCVVVRATLGWEDGVGGRKSQDWLTHGQLRARTGRSSEAVCRALDALVQRGLLEVRDERGGLLPTPQERRGASGRLYFALGAAAGASERQPTYEAAPGVSESEESISQSETAKAKTTKETEDKKTPDGVRRFPSPPGDKPVDNGTQRIGENGSRSDKGEPDPDVRRFLLAYRELFAQHSARGEPPPIRWGRDGRLVKGLLAQYGYERLLELLEGFFVSGDAWVRKRGYALDCFPTLLPTLLMDKEAPAVARRRAVATPVVIHGPSDRQWQQAGDIAVSEKSLFERYPQLRTKARRLPP